MGSPGRFEKGVASWNVIQTLSKLGYPMESQWKCRANSKKAAGVAGRPQRETL